MKLHVDYFRNELYILVITQKKEKTADYIARCLFTNWYCTSSTINTANEYSFEGVCCHVQIVDRDVECAITSTSSGIASYEQT